MSNTVKMFQYRKRYELTCDLIVVFPTFSEAVVSIPQAV